MRVLKWKRGCAVLAASVMLAGCSGDDKNDDDAAASAASGSAAKVLFIGMDGLTYDAYLQGMADQSLPNLAQLTATRAWTGGVTGAVTQQPTLLAPGWTTLLTGQWADVHGVRSNAPKQTPKAATLFQYVKAAKPAARIAAAFHSPLLADLSRQDRDAGYVQSLTDCAGLDDCVASQARDRIAEGYDVVVAQFGAAEHVAAAVGLGADYQAILRQTDAAIGALLKQVADRRARDSDENWLVLVASSHGLDRNGASSGLPLSSAKTILLAMNRPRLLGGSVDDAAFDGDWNGAWYALPSAADVAPTLLAHLGALPAVGQYRMAGAALTESLALRHAVSRTSMDNTRVSLSWTRVGTPTDEVTITRDGQPIARLPGAAVEYVDTGFSFSAEGVREMNYVISIGAAATAVRATVVYTPPLPLLPSLRDNLTMLFPFEGDLTDKAAGGGAITPYDGVQQPVFADPGIFGKMFRNERGADPLGAFKLDYPAGLLDSVQAFTIGFWYQSDGIANDRSILGNKDYLSGVNPGIIIAQWSGPELRFNLGDGANRADINGVKFTANKPVYVAMAIDKTARTMTAYVYDTELGFFSRSASTGAVDLTKIAGVFGPHLGLNEDGRGTYGVCCAGTKGPYTMYFDDLAFWSRALTEAEIKALALSGKSVAEWFP